MTWNCVTGDLILISIFKENGYTDVNISHNPHDEFNIPGAINLVAIVFAIVTKKWSTGKTVNYLEMFPTKKLYYLLIIVIHAHKLEGVANNSADLAQSIMASSSPDEDTDEEEEEVEVKRKPTNNEW